MDETIEYDVYVSDDRDDEFQEAMAELTKSGVVVEYERQW